MIPCLQINIINQICLACCMCTKSFTYFNELVPNNPFVLMWTSRSFGFLCWEFLNRLSCMALVICLYHVENLTSKTVDLGVRYSTWGIG